MKSQIQSLLHRKYTKSLQNQITIYFWKKTTHKYNVQVLHHSWFYNNFDISHEVQQLLLWHGYNYYSYILQMTELQTYSVIQLSISVRNFQGRKFKFNLHSSQMQRSWEMA
jgi:hypothetical protein